MSQCQELSEMREPRPVTAGVLLSRKDRRCAMQSLVAAAGGMLTVAAALGERRRFVLAQDDEDDNSGRGRGRGRGGDDNQDNSGPGNAGDRPLNEAQEEEEAAVPVTGGVPERSEERRVGKE